MILRVACACAAFALPACDGVLHLTHVPDRGSSGSCVPGLDDGEDEDCDGFIDGLDPCPAEPDTMPPADGDRDGVGDACDPDPTVADQLLFFDGFANLSGNWTSAGQWSAANGVLANAQYLGTVWQPVAMSRMRVATYVEIGDTLTNPIVTLMVEDRGGTAYKCSVLPIGGGVILDFYVGSQPTVRQPVYGTGRLRLELVDDAVRSKVACRATYAGTGTVENTVMNTVAVQGTRLFLQTMDVHATFDSVTVTGLP